MVLESFTKFKSSPLAYAQMSPALSYLDQGRCHLSCEVQPSSLEPSAHALLQHFTALRKNCATVCSSREAVQSAKSSGAGPQM